MTGDTVINLGKQVLKARAVVNSARTVYGAQSAKATDAALELNRLQRAARESMS